MKKTLFLTLVTFILSTPLIFAGTTGKIAGTITDAGNGEPLPGVNVVLEGTTMGAITNLDGYFVILNVPPGRYTLRASYIGYSAQRVTNVAVNIDLTTTQDFKMKQEAVAGEEVVVVAERPVVVRDVSSSQANIESEQVSTLPVQSVEGVVGLQAGIRGFEVRGGGVDQTAFMLDGVVLRDERTNRPIANISLSSIQEINVNTGGFNAEYGDVRSGIVNVVTKDPSHYSGTVEVRYSPADQKHFGMSLYDPNSYWIRPYLDDAVCWTGTQNGAWDAFTQKQYPKFDGWNFISEQTLKKNSDPADDLTPEAAQRLFKFQHRRQGDIKDPDYTIDAGLGGKVPFIGQRLWNMRFFASIRRERTMYLIPLSRDDYGDYTGTFKLTADISKSMKLNFSALYGEIHGVNDNGNGEAGYFYDPADIALVIGGGPELFRSFRDAIMYAPEYYCPTDIYTRQFAAKFTHLLSTRTFYEVSLEQGGRNYFTGPDPIRNRDKIYLFGNSYYVDEAPFGFEPLPSTGIDGLRMGVGFSNSRDRSRIRNTNFKINMTSQVNSTNQVKAGIDILYTDHNVDYRSVDIVLPASRPATQWRKFPVRAGAYLQDKLEFKGMIANLGLRVDYSDPQGDWYDPGLYDRNFFSSDWTPAYNQIVPKEAIERKVYWSPRVGISHPITVNSKLYFNYGHFRQRIDPAALYQNRRVTGNQVSRIGAPNNDLARTIAYELGYEHSLFNQVLLKAAGYYKDVSDEPRYVRFISADSKVNYERAYNILYEDIRGFEFQLSRYYGDWVNGFINYTYEVISSGYFGKLAYFENPADQRAYDIQNPEQGYQTKPRPRPYARANVVITSPDNFGPELLGYKVLGGWQASFLANWRSGQWRTYNPGNKPNIQYNVKWDDYFNVDLRLSRKIQVKDAKIDFFVDFNNLFNTKNFSLYGFSTVQDYNDYMQSLRLSREATEKLGYIQPGQDWRFGNDQVGDLRPAGVAYEPYDPNDPTKTKADLDRILNTKAYIDNPDLSSLWYLEPRDIFFGLRLSYDLR